MTATDLAIPVLGGIRVIVAEGDADDSATLTALLRLNGFDARDALDRQRCPQCGDSDHPGSAGCRPRYAWGRWFANSSAGYGGLPNPPSVIVVTAYTAQSVRRAAMSSAGLLSSCSSPPTRWNWRNWSGS